MIVIKVVSRLVVVMRCDFMRSELNFIYFTLSKGFKLLTINYLITLLIIN
jgi:hypothetical protein